MLPKPLYEKLQAARKSETLQLKPCSGIKPDVCLRNYQSVGTFHIIAVARMILGDDTGLGKTLQTLAAIAYLRERNPSLRVLVIASKSALYQWKSEVAKFLLGVKAEVIASGGVKKEIEPEEWSKITEYQLYQPAPRKKKAEKQEGEEDLPPIPIDHLTAVQRLKQGKTVQFTFKHAEWGDWGGKVLKFSLLDEKPLRVELTGKHSRRYQFNEAFKGDTNIFIMNYNTLNEEYRWLLACDPVGGKIEGQIPKLDGPYMTVFDEASYFKSTKTLTHRAAKATSMRAVRALGLTATPIKNRLEEAFAIFSVLVPGLFKNVTQFRKLYCNFVLLPMPNGRKFPKLTGYKNLWHFRETIDPYYLGRKKFDVAKELPPIISKEVFLDMTEKQSETYRQALDGLLQLDSGEEKKVERLTALGYCQQISDSPHIIGVTGDSSKEDELFDQLENELDGQKVIVYTRYKKMIDRLTEMCNKKKIKATRITGDENAQERADNQAAFQDDESGVNVIFINSAGSESINLQKAGVMIFFDLPWSYGEYIQLIGRPQRIGSEHSVIVVYHYINRDTIDEHVLKVLQSKKGLVASIFGESSMGELEFKEEGMADLIFESMVEAEKSRCDVGT